MSAPRHVILNHVDSPLKILFWTQGEILLFLVPFFLGMILDQFCLGVGVSLGNAWGVSRYKRMFGQGHLQAVLYWYLPPIRCLRILPLSSVRTYVG